jgi:hypothetical protein
VTAEVLSHPALNFFSRDLWAGHKRFRVKARLRLTSIVVTAVFSMRLRTHPSEVSGEHNGGHKHAEADRDPFQNHIGAFG